MKRNKLHDMLKRPDKGMMFSRGVSGVLSRLFRQILCDLEIGTVKFQSYLNDYVRDKRNKVPDNRRDQSSVQGNLMKALYRPDMTWKVFCQALRFLQFTRFEISLKCYRSNGSYSLHTLPVDLYDGRENEHEHDE